MNICKCENPDHSGEYVPVGTTGNITDWEICDNCKLPIQGTAVTHIEEEED